MSRTEQQLRRNQRRAKKEHARRLRPTHHARLSDLPEGVKLHSYRISFDPLAKPAEQYNRLLEEVLADVRADIWKRIHDEPRAAIPVLEELLTRFPDAPMLLNWLATAQAKAGEMEKAHTTARRNLEANPSYLFAKINAASYRLLDGDIAGVELILDNKFDLQLHYPDRDVFHISEFLAFSAVVVQYWMHKGKFEHVRRLFDVMDQLAPDHDTTRRMREAVEGSYLLELARSRSQAALRQGYLPRW